MSQDIREFESHTFRQQDVVGIWRNTRNDLKHPGVAKSFGPVEIRVASPLSAGSLAGQDRES